MSFFFKKRLNDTSISKKLYFTIGIMATLVTIELITLWFAISTLSSVRSFVAGEGLWSKAEKDAVLYLGEYAHFHREKDYDTFLTLLKVSKGDKQARVALLSRNPDINIARQGLLAGLNPPDDINGMITLILHFHDSYYISKAFTLWVQAEPIITKITAIGDSLHSKIRAGTPQADIDQTWNQVEFLNQKVTVMENGFSSTLGEGARWLEDIVLKVLLALSLTIGSTSILITISVSRGIEKGLKAILDGAYLIGKGLLTTRVKVYSNDEIGMLAVSFNNMTDKLERNIQEIMEKEQSLIKAKQKAESSEKVKQLFIMNMSHEIRTPMNAILGFAHLLEDSVSEKEHQDYVQLLIRSGDELLVILNDILDFANMETDEVTLKSVPFNLNNTIVSLSAEHDLKAAAKGIHFSYYVDKKIPNVILGDADKITQILNKLLSNAIKFTDSGAISLSVFCIKDDKYHLEVEFSVKDTGIGISEEQQEKIFESFEQADAGSGRKFSGTGLGLSIVKQLVELHEGKVFINSTLARGSEFHFRISFLKVKNRHHPQEYKIDSDSLDFDQELLTQKTKILIVDDNPINRLLAVKLLQKEGFETDVAENGKIGLLKCKNYNYDLILMDLQMPEMDGYEATKEIRGLPGNKGNIPIIALTAHATTAEKERCMALGMNDFISKPFNDGDLYTRINKLVNNNIYL